MSDIIKITGRLLIFDKVNTNGVKCSKDCKITYPEEVPFIHEPFVLGFARIREDRPYV